MDADMEVFGPARETQVVCPNVQTKWFVTINLVFFAASDEFLRQEICHVWIIDWMERSPASYRVCISAAKAVARSVKYPLLELYAEDE